MTPQIRIVELEAENARLSAAHTALHQQVAALSAPFAELRARLAGVARDSHSSSKPPSSDEPWREARPPKTRSLRQPSGNKVGGQIGHHDQTLRPAALPATVVEHRPLRCAAYRAMLPADTEEYRQTWARDLMKAFLRDRRTAADQARAQGPPTCLQRRTRL